MIKYALFDMNGLLFDTERLNVETFLTFVGPEQQLEYDPEFLLDLIGNNRDEAEKKGKESFGEKYSWSESLEISYKHQTEYIKENGTPVKNGAIDILKWLTENGVKCALITRSGKRIAEFFIEHSKLEGYFAAKVFGSDININTHRSNSYTSLYELALKKLECTDKDEVIIFEDSTVAVKAGIDNGYKVIAIPDLVEIDKEYSERCFAVLSELDDAMWLLYDNIK